MEYMFSNSCPYKSVPSGNQTSRTIAYIYMHTYIHTYIHTHIHTHIHTCTICVYTHMSYTYIYIYTDAHCCGDCPSHRLISSSASSFRSSGEVPVQPLVRPLDLTTQRDGFDQLGWRFRNIYPLVNIQKTMENHHFKWVNPLYRPFSVVFCLFTGTFSDFRGKWRFHQDFTSC